MDKKKVKGEIKTYRYVVPVLEIRESMMEIMARSADGGLASALPANSQDQTQIGSAPIQLQTAPTENADTYQPASEHERSAIRARINSNTLSIPNRSILTDWWAGEVKAKRLHPLDKLAASEVEIVTAKLDELAPLLIEDEIVDAEFLDEGTMF